MRIQPAGWGILMRNSRPGWGMLVRNSPSQVGNLGENSWGMLAGNDTLARPDLSVSARHRIVCASKSRSDQRSCRTALLRRRYAD